MDSKIELAYQMRALIVDDDQFMQELMRDMLKQLGLNSISTASSGDDALQHLEKSRFPPNLLLIDLHMPNTDGFQFMEMLGQRKFKGGVILISGQRAQVLQSAELMGQLYNLNILATQEKPPSLSGLRMALTQFKPR